MVVATAARNGNGKSAVKESDEDVLVIAPLRIGRILVPIKGTQPLITNKFSDEAERKLEESQQGPRIKAAKAPRDGVAEFLAARYIIKADPDGNPDLDICGFQSGAIRKAMVSAAMRVTEAKGTWIRAIINVEGENGTGLISIDAPPPEMRTDHVVQAGRGNLRYRPAFWPWKALVPITFNLDQIKASDVVNLVQQAGFSIGIGDWRPEKNGSFGTFEVESEKLVLPR